MDKSTLEATIALDYKGDDDQLKILDDLSIKSSISTDLKSLLAEASLDLSYDKKSVAKVLTGVNNEDVYIDLIKLYNEQFYYELPSNVVDIISEMKILIKATDQISLKFDKKYADIVEDVLGDDISSSFNKVTVNIDYKTAIELLETILQEAEDDEKLMESVRKSGIDFIKRVLKEKDSVEILFNEDDLEEALEVFEKKDDFESIYLESLEDLIGELEYQRENGYFDDAVSEMAITFKFGLFNNISGINYGMEFGDSSDEIIKLTFDADIHKGAKFTKFKSNDAIELQDLVTDRDQLQEVADEVVNNFVESIKNNEKLVEEIEDITGHDIDDLNNYIMDYISY